jgi:hypothetical protein
MFTEAARFRFWLDVEAALAELTIIPAENAGFEPRNANWPMFRGSLISASGQQHQFDSRRC